MTVSIDGTLGVTSPKVVITDGTATVTLLPPASGTLTGVPLFQSASGAVTLTNATGGSLVLQPAAGSTTATTLAFPNGVGTNGQVLTSNGTGGMTWGSGGAGGLTIGTTTIATGTTGSILINTAGILQQLIMGTGVSALLAAAANGPNGLVSLNGSGALPASSSGTFGTAGTTTGSLDLYNASSSFGVSIKSANNAAAWTLTLPTGPGTAGYVLKTDGAGNTSWQAESAAAGGATTQVQYNNAGSLAGVAGFTFNGTSTVALGVAGTSTGTITLAGSSSGVVTVKPAAAAGTWSLTLPTTSGTNGQFLQTDGAGVTSWASASGSGTVNSGTANQIAYYSATGTAVSGSANITASSGALTLGVAGTAAGSVVLSGSASGTVTVKTAAAAGAWTMTLPTTAGTAGQVLKTDGTGITSWQADSAAAGGATTQVQYNNAGALDGVAGFTFNGTSTVALGVAGTSTGTITLAGSGSGIVTVKPATAAGTWSLTLPTTAGSSGGLLQTDGTGVTSWTTPVSGSLVGTTSTQTLTNKIITARVSSAASITSPLGVNSGNFDQYCATAQAASLTISADAGTPTDGQKLTFRIKDNGTSQTLTWASGANGYRAIGITLPTATTAGKLTYVGFIYNAADSRWDGVATVTEA